MKDTFEQRRDLIEKQEHYEQWFAKDILGHRSNYNPLRAEVEDSECPKDDSE